MIGEFFWINMKKNKGRTFLILFCIQLSTLLFFASCCTYRNMMDISYKQLRQESGKTDIVIKPMKSDISSYFMKEDKLQNKEITSTVYSIVHPARIYESNNKSIKFTVQGITLEDYKKVYGYSLVDNASEKEFTDNSIIVSKKTVEKYGIDDTKPISIEINSHIYEFQLFAVAELEGYFFENGQVHLGVVPVEYLQNIMNVSAESVNTAYLRLEDEGKIEEVIHRIEDQYSNSIVKEPFTSEEAKQESQAISIVLLAITLIVFVVSGFIILSAFKVIMQERLPALATFRSLGATLLQTVISCLVESLIFAVIGALLGCIIGIIIMTVVLYYTSSDVVTLKQIFISTLNIKEIILAGVSSIVLTVVSSLLPVLRASKYSLISTIGHGLSINKYEKKKTKIIIATVSLVVALLLTFINTSNLNLIEVIISIILYLIGLILLMPLIASTLGKLLGGIFKKVFGSITELSLTNFNNNKLVYSSISLIGIGIACIFTISVLSSDVITEIVNSFVNRNYDLMIEDETFDKANEQKLKEIDGIDDCYGIYERHKVKVSNLDTEIWGLQGIDSDKFTDYWDFDSTYNPDIILPQLNQSRSIVVTNTLKEKYKLDIGDSLMLEFKSGIKEYKVVGFFDSILFLGNYALVGNNFLKEDDLLDNYFRIYIKTTSDLESLKNLIEETFSSKSPNVLIMEELKNDFLGMYSQFFVVLKFFVLISSLIGIFGVMNNTILCFISRKKVFSILRSGGMEARQLKKMLLIEALLVSIIGAIIGILSSLILTKQVQNILSTIHQPIEIGFSFVDCIIAAIIGIVVILCSYILPIKKTEKLNIVEGIKQH